MIEFHATINQAPHGKGRPRATSINGRARMFTPTATREWEHFAAAELRAAWAAFTTQRHDDEIRAMPVGTHYHRTPPTPATGPIGLEIVAVFPRTQELLRVVKRTGKHAHSTFRIPHPGKPDLDNIAKSACDAIEKAGIVGDDKQIALLTIGKHYAMIGEVPHVEIRLWSLT